MLTLSHPYFEVVLQLFFKTFTTVRLVVICTVVWLNHREISTARLTISFDRSFDKRVLSYVSRRELVKEYLSGCLARDVFLQI